MYISQAKLMETAAALKSGDLDLAGYINDICDRVETVEPHIMALLPEPGRRQRLLREAMELARLYPDPQQRPPLYGVLVGVKDIFRANGFPTRAGSKLPHTLFDGPEAVSVTKLREAGALVLGKTVTTEFAYFEPGPTRNPHNPEHTPGGSSSGSAAAVAAGYCQLALGTQTVGSVIRPAAFCGIVGFKPSYGRIATDGLLYFSPSVDHIGLFTQDAAGMKAAAAVVCREWAPDGGSGLGDQSQGRPVLGVPEGPFLEQAYPEALDAFEYTLARLVKRGYSIKRVQAFGNIQEINLRHKRLTAAEMAIEHKDWFAQYEQLYRPRTAELIRLGQEVSGEELEAARASRGKLREELERLMEENGIDFWLSPAARGTAPHGIESTGDPIMNLPWTNCGVPVVTLPAGTGAKGLPLGLQISARFMADESLLHWAVEAEKILK